MIDKFKRGMIERGYDEKYSKLFSSYPELLEYQVKHEMLLAKQICKDAKRKLFKPANRHEENLTQDGLYNIGMREMDVCYQPHYIHYALIGEAILNRVMVYLQDQIDYAEISL